MSRVLASVLVLAAAGCSNAPLAGTLDAIWPARAGSGGDRPPPEPRPPVGEPRPTLPPPAAGGAGESLPPPADLAPRQ